MYFILERINKILTELKRYIYFNKTSIKQFDYKEGYYSDVNDVNKNGDQWNIYTSGMKWGGRDLHAWFRFKVNLTDLHKDKIVALYIHTGQGGWDALNPQFLVYIDGEVAQGADVNHREVIVTLKIGRASCWERV